MVPVVQFHEGIGLLLGDWNDLERHTKNPTQNELFIIPARSHLIPQLEYARKPIAKIHIEIRAGIQRPCRIGHGLVSMASVIKKALICILDILHIIRRNELVDDGIRATQLSGTTHFPSRNPR